MSKNNLTVDEINLNKILYKDIPHRLNLLLGFTMMQCRLKSIDAEYRHNINLQLIEMSMVAARMFIDFFGFNTSSFNNQYYLVEAKRKLKNKGDIKVNHIANKDLQLGELSEDEIAILLNMYISTNKSVAHLTSGGGDYKVFFDKNKIAVILKLLNEHIYIPNNATFPIDIDEYLKNDQYYWSYSNYLSTITSD